MRKYICMLGILASSVMILSGCENSEKKVLKNNYSLKEEMEATIQDIPLAEDYEKKESSLTLANIINLSDWIKNDANVYLKHGDTKEEFNLLDHNLEQGDIVQINEPALENFKLVMDGISLEKVDSLWNSYPQYHILLKDEKTNSFCHVEVWEDGVFCINWLDYYKISGEWDSSVIENLFEKSTEVEILTIEEAFKKNIVYEKNNSSTALYLNKRNNLTMVISSGMSICNDETFERPYQTTLECIGYDFDAEGTKYSFQILTIWYETDGKTVFTERSKRGASVDYITGELVNY